MAFSLQKLETIRTNVEQLKGRRSQLQQNIHDEKEGVKETKRELHRYEQAREIIRAVGLQTQSQLSYHIGDITTLALESIFPDAYEVVAEFVQRRNRTECDLYFQRDEMKIDPLMAAGGGVVDVASFALRAASWSMQFPRSRNTLFLDEPFKHLSASLLPLASEMLKQISQKLGMQIIFITHSEELAIMADRTITVSINKGCSTINYSKGY